jgi:hypothetical protein
LFLVETEHERQDEVLTQTYQINNESNSCDHQNQWSPKVYLVSCVLLHARVVLFFFFGAMCDVQNISKTISKVRFVFVSKISK